MSKLLVATVVTTVRPTYDSVLVVPCISGYVFVVGIVWYINIARKVYK